MMTLEEVKQIISDWAMAVEQEYCVGAKEVRALYAQRDDVLAFIDELAAQQRQDAEVDRLYRS